MHRRRLATSFAATAALVLMGAGPALAEDHTETIDINPSHLDTKAGEFQEGKECPDDEFGALDLDSNEDGWHFVLPEATASDFVSLTLKFTDLEDEEVEVIIDKVDPDISSGEGWIGYITEAGESGGFRHAWVVTEAGWTLEEASALVDDLNEEADQDFFVLSHTCPGEQDENGKDEEENGDEEDENGKEDEEEDEPEVPKEVPAGHEGSAGGFNAGTLGLIAAATALVAGAAALIRRRFVHGS